MQENYKILGVSENATKEEIERAYITLKEKYSKERFCEGEVGNQAARNLTKIETAYTEIMNNFKNNQNKSGNFSYQDIENAIKNGDYSDAQYKLDNAGERTAEWHYLQSVVYYKKNWFNESKKQLEIAMEMEPQNFKYSDAYTKLKQKMEYTEKQFHSGNSNYNGNQNGYQNPNDRQMGEEGVNDCCNICMASCCSTILCNSCCR